MPSPTSTQPAPGLNDDAELARRIARHDQAAFESVMRHHNTKLFRVARSILRNDADAQDALQEAYLAAYRGIAGFHGAATLSTWLTRIVINQALGRLRTRKRDAVVVAFAGERGEHRETEEERVVAGQDESPEQATLLAQMRRLLEQKIDALPLAFRTVFMMREVEEMTVEETAECLQIPPATVRTRLRRARAKLRESLATELDIATGDVFRFAGARCDRVVAGVLEQLRSLTAVASVAPSPEDPREA